MLDVSNISVSFGGVHAVKSVSFAIAEKRITSVIGPNGAGKTTLFNIITGFQRPDTGSVAFQDQQMISLRPSRIAAAGLVRTFQKTEVFKTLTVQQAVEIGTACGRDFPIWRIFAPGAIRRAQETARREASAILDQCGLAAAADKECAALSYGEQRILEIALALAARPKLLMLDEPASGLNPTEARKLGELLAGIRGAGVGIVLIEHNMQLVMSISEQVVVLHHGEKIAEGEPSAVAKDPRVIEAYLGGGGVVAA